METDSTTDSTDEPAPGPAGPRRPVDEPPSAQPLSLAGFADAAASVLPPDVWDFVAGGSGGETTLDANRAAFDRVFLVPRVLRDVSGCATDAALLGRPVRMPVAVAPVAYQRLFDPAGELATARAAKAAGIPFTASTLSSVPIEEIAAIGGSVWFQLYWLQDTALTLDLVRRAEGAGCEAVVLTVDVPWMGRRLRDVRNRFVLPGHVRAANLTTTAAAAPWSAEPAAGDTAHRRLADASAVAEHTSRTFSSSLTWSSVEMLRRSTRLPLVLKGVLSPEDALRAAECGCDAVVVSNHGGRQLDGAVPSIDALAGLVSAVGATCEVLLDSGVRGGTDVLKALAMGAHGVLVGRPVIWGLSTAGEAGVRQVLELLAVELRDALGLSGCGGVDEARRLRAVR